MPSSARLWADPIEPGSILREDLSPRVLADAPHLPEALLHRPREVRIRMRIVRRPDDALVTDVADCCIHDPVLRVRRDETLPPEVLRRLHADRGQELPPR